MYKILNDVFFLLKPWEKSNIIIILYIYLTIVFLKLKKKNIIIILNIIYIVIQTKLDFFSQHILFINKLQEILIKNIIPIIINKFINLNKKNINKFLYFKKFKYINYIIFITSEIQLLPITVFYNMINSNIYKFKNIINLILYIKYWTIIFNDKINKNKIKKIINIYIKIITKIILGNYIYFNNKNIYNIYKMCGKIKNITISEDQQIYGLITWIINSMMLLINIIYF